MSFATPYKAPQLASFIATQVLSPLSPPATRLRYAMPRTARYPVRTQQCFCTACKGASLPWSTWARHQKALAERIGDLGREAGLVDPAGGSTETAIAEEETEAITAALKQTFSQRKSKKSQRVAHIRARLLTVRDDLHRLRDDGQKLAAHVTFLTPPGAEDAKRDPEPTSLGAYWL